MNASIGSPPDFQAPAEFARLLAELSQLKQANSRLVEESQAAAEALRLSEERYALAVESAVDGLWDWDITTDRMFFSERCQALLGLPPEKTTVRPRADWRHMVVVHPDDEADQARSIAEHLAGGPPYGGEWRMLHADGTYRWIATRGICVRDADGKPTRLAGSLTDVDHRHRAEAALIRAQRLEATGRLAGGIAHDFNNILAVILGYGEMALDDAPAGSRLRRGIDSILSAAERGSRLVEGILAFSRSGVAERSLVHAEGVVLEVLDLLGYSLPAEIRVETDLRSGAAAVLGVSTQMHQVVMNLATNAIQAMPTGGVLRVGMETRVLQASLVTNTGSLAPAEYLLLTMSDSGPGIPSDVVDQVFEPFFTTKDPGTGTGLGLAIVHGIVSEMGGAIDIETVPGVGTTFAVYLPRQGDWTPASSLAEPPTTRGEHQQILVVDDEPALVALMVDTLLALGYTPVGFSSSEKALSAFRAHPERFDAVITDERMPGLSGTRLIVDIREKRPDMPIILVSGYPGAMVKGRASEAGADEVLKKPLRRHEVAAALARVLPRTMDAG